MLFIKLAQLKPVASFDEIITKLNRLAAAFETADGADTISQVRESPPPSEPKAPEETSTKEEKLEPTTDLAEIWQKFLALSGATCPALMPVLEKSLLTKIGDDFIEITVTENSFYAARLRDKKSVEALQSVCVQLFKRKMKIEVVESKKKASKEVQPQESDRAKSGRTESDRERRLKKDALDHPLVIDALDVFRGRVVDVKIL